MHALRALLQAGEVDMTLFFRGLSDLDLAQPTLAPLAGSFYDRLKMQSLTADFDAWFALYCARVERDGLPPAERRRRMHASNPVYVLRNYLAQQAIDRAEAGDPSAVLELLEVMRTV